ncbi:MAG: hypothetical protein IT452_02395 [Planctomycetia bacterium]|nr:hypothetical protein [Planctomycetia bacterium]
MKIWKFTIDPWMWAAVLATVAAAQALDNSAQPFLKWGLETANRGVSQHEPMWLHFLKIQLGLLGLGIAAGVAGAVRVSRRAAPVPFSFPQTAAIVFLVLVASLTQIRWVALSLGRSELSETTLPLASTVTVDEARLDGVRFRVRSARIGDVHDAKDPARSLQNVLVLEIEISSDGSGGDLRRLTGLCPGPNSPYVATEGELLRLVEWPERFSPAGDDGTRTLVLAFEPPPADAAELELRIPGSLYRGLRIPPLTR